MNRNILTIILSIFSGLLTALIIYSLKFIKENYGSINIALKALINYNKHIRFSMSYIFRIKIDTKYLLIKGKRIEQYQPVGGVYKIYNKEKLSQFNTRDDKEMPIDTTSRDDLRVRVPGKNVLKFLKWFHNRTDREISVHREFIEELVRPSFVTFSSFSEFKPVYICSKCTGIKYSKYMKCNELLHYDVFELTLTDCQKEEIFKVIERGTLELALVSEDQIERESLDLNGVSTKIGEHAKYLLS
ncbi:SMODS-associated NUDIX domain-containing protein [Fusibacter ferrireducens]|uniref:CD-NTase-associated protein 16 NUDIX domain-containing protein n=1 Tax=Fusibacter ferrireducens TaxID=2785058 RepID=A0ABR9ZUW8_9FIRM|nr:hypothetical protein [Fusibacter ferrireducens]MBF4694257.1 hypothetical protein [Fusibacter ferrireducens]